MSCRQPLGLYNSFVIKPPSLSVSQVGGIAPTGPAELVRRDAGRVVIAIQAGTRATDLVVGEAVTARLVEPLHNQQWAAVIKGGLFMLQLPSAATVVDPAPDAAPTPPWTLAKGGTLSLQVATLDPQLTFVLAESLPSASSSGAVALQLSVAAQMLSQLIHASEHSMLRGDPATPAHLPVLLSNPAAPAAERAQALAQAISHSGLFYESHLRAWAEGRMPQGSLGTEPQARIADALKDASPATRDAATAELGGMLQRQLDVLDGKPLVFAGFAWPGQPAEWRIQRESNPSDDDADTDESLPQTARNSLRCGPRNCIWTCLASAHWPPTCG